MLAHLNVVGFRNYAIELVNFIEVEMTGQSGGYEKYVKSLYRTEELRNLKQNPLYPILKFDVFKEWKMYGECRSQEEWDLLYKNCFTSETQDYAPSIIFSELK